MRWWHFLGILVLIVFGVWALQDSEQLRSLREAVLPGAPIPDVITVTDGSRTHVTLSIDGEQVRVSSGSANFRKPFRRGDFIVWLEVPQEKAEKYVIRYHIPTQTQVRLTESGASQHARVNTQGVVVWQQWVDDTWQVFYFDGESTQQMTSGEIPRINPDIYENTIAFAERVPGEAWNIVELDVATSERKIVPNSSGEKYPLFVGSSLSFVSPTDLVILEAEE